MTAPEPAAADGVGALPTAADGVGPLLGRLAADLSRSDRLHPAQRRRLLRELAVAMSLSAKNAGAGAVASGRWLGDVVTEALPYLPLRDETTLRTHHLGRDTEAIADTLIRNASRATALVGATGGAVTAIAMGPSSVVSVPVALAAETALMALIEVKLVGELHEIYGASATGTQSQRAAAYLMSWVNRRGIDPLHPTTAMNALGVSTRRLVGVGLGRRATRSAWSLIPFFAGAALGASANHKETRRMAESVRRDLRERRRVTSGWAGTLVDGVLDATGRLAARRDAAKAVEGPGGTGQPPSRAL